MKVDINVANKIMTVEEAVFSQKEIVEFLEQLNLSSDWKIVFVPKQMWQQVYWSINTSSTT